MPDAVFDQHRCTRTHCKSLGAQVLMPDAVFDHVVGDVLTMIVVELMAIPPQVRVKLKASHSLRFLCGWTFPMRPCLNGSV